MKTFFARHLTRHAIEESVAPFSSDLCKSFGLKPPSSPSEQSNKRKAPRFFNRQPLTGGSNKGRPIVLPRMERVNFKDYF